MAVGNVAVPDIIYPIEGIKLSATAAGVRYKDRDDLVVVEIADTATTAVVTTKNTFVLRLYGCCVSILPR